MGIDVGGLCKTKVDSSPCAILRKLDALELMRTGEALISIAETMTASHAPAPIDYERVVTPQPLTRASPAVTASVPDRFLASVAAKIMRANRMRGTYFHQHLFADPAWNMLLDLFIQTTRLTRVSVTSLCIASDVPPTTALRWIAILEADGLISKEPLETDRRSSTVYLTKDGLRLIRKYLTDWIELMGLNR